MIQHDITACFGRKIEAERLVVGYEDSGVAFRVRLVTMEKASAWNEKTKPYTIPEGSTARLSVVRPDRAECSMEATIECDSTILCPLDPVACAVPGVCTAAVSIYGPDKRKITTVSWDYEVPYKGNSREVPGSGGYYVDTVDRLIKAADKAAERAEAAAKTAVDATGSAGLPTFGKEDAGKLLYIAEDGKVRPLTLGKCLGIVDGVLTLKINAGSTPDGEIVEVVVDDDGILHVYRGGVEVYAVVDDDGVVSWPGIALIVDDDGYLNYDKEVR